MNTTDSADRGREIDDDSVGGTPGRDGGRARSISDDHGGGWPTGDEVGMQPSGFEAAMGRALAAARTAAEAGEVPVGAVLLDPAGMVVETAYNARERLADPTAHAEMVVLRQAGVRAGSWRLTGYTLVVTLEPCTMCAGAAVLARVARVVYGAVDPKGGAVGSLWDVVRDRRLNHRPEVIGGVLAAESAALLSEFFARQRGD
jgi:tRNA(adenine34) deaminase